MKKISSWLVTVIIIGAIFLVWPLFILDEDRSNLSLFGYEALIVLSDSMVPEFETQDLLIINQTKNPAVGDVITFKQGETLVTHRLIGIKDGQFKTKGDNNDLADSSLVDPSEVQGVHQMTIPKFGYVISYLTSLTGFITLIAAPILIAVILEIFKWIFRNDNSAGSKEVIQKT
ncbi:signal peptidase I [Salipaludibacillus aurantiacus]|uniref:Signal peptidase I n=1 Tax=Salipaludibacillus aurantiacus TaxID=1601833 RepID=A0A1H9UDJ3_9BACI|nr:signal peptidase I [Salipaludibacillus aurantiacus]SES07640.1 signal peptidase, endoplasmic reticulum-type [Salipaludibacillus aurantiacus]